ncbi:MAG: hypothetical protein KatS3mg002_1512 [Candidatus Woesearchaeota archaeon]|nr:MAG: hypothetical protein KatS3mg002_1512 [Candidatus Woesearchaeota archaeon]
MLPHDAANKDTDIYINDEYLLTVKSSKKAIIKINKSSSQGREILHALNSGEKVFLKQ